MTKQIPINHKGEILYALVDDEDYPLLSRHVWYIRSDHGSSYPATTILTVGKHRKILAMHNMILGCGNIDHKSMNKLDNQKENLREASYQQNGWNKGKSKACRHGEPTSQYKGVSYSPYKGRDRWVVLIKHVPEGEKKKNGQTLRCGYFWNEIEAAKAYNKKVIELRGEFAWVNPIPL